jgi:hypothetical protein
MLTSDAKLISVSGIIGQYTSKAAIDSRVFKITATRKLIWTMHVGRGMWLSCSSKQVHEQP